MVFEWYYGLPSETHLLFTDWLLRPGPNPFERFIYTWIASNWLGRAGRADKSDREWVNAIALSGAIGADFDELVATDAEYRERFKRFSDWWPIFKAQEQRGKPPAPYGAERPEQVKHWMALGVSHAPECDHIGDLPRDWAHTVWALYQVRCNLFHGEKSMLSDADQRLVKVAADVLQGFLSATGYLSGRQPSSPSR